MIPDTMNRQLGKLLADTILRFCRKHNYFDEELKVQGTICITSDASAFLVTQISDRFHEASSVSKSSKCVVPSWVTIDCDNTNGVVNCDEAQNLVVRETNKIKTLTELSAFESSQALESKDSPSSSPLRSNGFTEFSTENATKHDAEISHSACFSKYNSSDDTHEDVKQCQQIQNDRSPKTSFNQPIQVKSKHIRRKNKLSHWNKTCLGKRLCGSRRPYSPVVMENDQGHPNMIPVKHEALSDDESHLKDSLFKREELAQQHPQNEISFTFSNEIAIGSYVGLDQNQQVEENTSSGLDLLTPQYASFQASSKSGGQNLGFGSTAVAAYVQRTFEGKYSCTLCQMEYSNRGTLQRHIEARHLGRNYECIICHMTFESHSGWSRHLRTKHSQHMPLECHFCGEKFKLTMALEQHIRRKHPAMEMSNNLASVKDECVT